MGYAADLKDRPVAAELLGEALVLWRSRDGSVRVLSDVCVHRGTALSLGWVSGDELVCAAQGRRRFFRR